MIRFSERVANHGRGDRNQVQTRRISRTLWMTVRTVLSIFVRASRFFIDSRLDRAGNDHDSLMKLLISHRKMRFRIVGKQGGSPLGRIFQRWELTSTVKSGKDKTGHYSCSSHHRTITGSFNRPLRRSKSPAKADSKLWTKLSLVGSSFRTFDARSFHWIIPLNHSIEDHSALILRFSNRHDEWQECWHCLISHRITEHIRTQKQLVAWRRWLFIPMLSIQYLRKRRENSRETFFQDRGLHGRSRSPQFTRNKIGSTKSRLTPLFDCESPSEDSLVAWLHQDLLLTMN
jgi:hypothetical protein